MDLTHIWQSNTYDLNNMDNFDMILTFQTLTDKVIFFIYWQI